MNITFKAEFTVTVIYYFTAVYISGKLFIFIKENTITIAHI